MSRFTGADSALQGINKARLSYHISVVCGMGDVGRERRSVESKEPTYVRFVNKSGKKAELIWLDYEGKKVPYIRLEPEEGVDINTYVTHPWLVEECDTGEALSVLSQPIYYPKASPERSVVHISLPLYSLRKAALLKLRDCLSSPDLSFHLQLPQTLQLQLFRLISNRTTLTPII